MLAPITTMNITTPKKLTLSGRAAAATNGLVSPSTPTSRSAESPRESPISLCSQISALTHTLEQQCGAVETENDDLKTEVAVARQQLAAERRKHEGEQKVSETTIGALEKNIQQLQTVNNVLQRTVASARERYQQELEEKEATLQDLKDANRLSGQVSHDLTVSKQVNQDLKTALKKAEETAREKALEVEASNQVVTEVQKQRINDLEAQLKEREGILYEHAILYDMCKSSIRNANFYVSVYETAMRAAFHSFDPVDGQPYFRTILQRVYERKLPRFYATAKSIAGRVGSVDDADEGQAMQALQTGCGEESSDDDEPILKKLRRKRFAEDDAGLEKKRVCLGEDVNDAGKDDGNEGGDATVEDYSVIFVSEDDEESDDARSDDEGDEEWLPRGQ